MFSRTSVLALLLAAMFALSACGGTAAVNEPAPAPQGGVPSQVQVYPTPNAVAPGKDGSYVTGYGANQDLHIYDLTGVVQTAPGNISNYSYSSSVTAVNGYASGYSSGGTDGKGIVKFLITGITYKNPYEGHGGDDKGYEPMAKAGEVWVLKFVDSSASVLAAGEKVTVRCRIDRDFMPAVGDQEYPSVDGITAEFDFCRVISHIQGGQVITGTAPVSSTGVISGTGGR